MVRFQACVHSLFGILFPVIIKVKHKVKIYDGYRRVTGDVDARWSAQASSQFSLFFALRGACAS